MRIGMQLKIARVEAEWTMAQLGNKAKVAISTICEIESGKKSPSAKTIEKLAGAMGYDHKLIKRAL